MSEPATVATPAQTRNERNRDYKRLWRIKNRESIKSYQQQYLAKNNDTCVCPDCKFIYKKYSKVLHEITKRHLTQIKMLEMEEKIKVLEKMVEENNLPNA